MVELFDTTELHQTAALARHAVQADAVGQGDLFAESGGDAAASAFVWPEPVGVLFTPEDAAGAMMLA